MTWQELSRAGEPGLGPRAASAAALSAAAAAPRAAASASHADEGLSALSDRDLPFEFRVLEKALEDVCGGLETAAAELEAEAHPALDALTQKVSSLNLERVKRVKGRMTRVTGRVASVRGEIQRFLDDDSDMRDMYLSRKAAAADAAAAPEAHVRPESGVWGHALLDPMDDDADIQQLEDLLETYFAQIDHAFNKMKALDEYVGSTEDYINIDLDSHRNQLIQIDLLLSFAMFITSLFTLVTGIFGMNLDSGLGDNPRAFDQVAGISTALVIVGFAAFVWVCRQQRLIQIF
jgi:magnesium transporter